MIAIPGKSGQSLVVFWLLTILAASAFFWLVVPALGIPVASALALLVPALVLLTCIVSGRCTFNPYHCALFLVCTIAFELIIWIETLQIICDPAFAVLIPSLALTSIIGAAAARKGVFPFGLALEKRAYVYCRLFLVSAIGVVLSSLLMFCLSDLILWGDAYSKGSDLLFPKLSTSIMPGFVLGLNGFIASFLICPFLYGMNLALVRRFSKRDEPGDPLGFLAVSLSLAMLPIILGSIPLVYASCVQFLKGGISYSEAQVIKNALLLSIALSTVPQALLGMHVAFAPGKAAKNLGVDIPPVRKGWQVPYVCIFVGLFAFGSGVGIPLGLQVFQLINPYFYTCTKGEVLYLIGKQRSAIEHYDNAIAIDSAPLEAYVSKGNILLRSGRAKEAATALQQGYDQGACSPWLLRMMVESYEKQGKIVEASKYRSHLALNYEKHLEWCKFCKRIVSDKGR